MTDRTRQGLAGLCASGALGLVAAFLYMWEDDAVSDIGGLFAFVAGLVALASLVALARDLLRG